MRIFYYRPKMLNRIVENMYFLLHKKRRGAPCLLTLYCGDETSEGGYAFGGALENSGVLQYL